MKKIMKIAAILILALMALIVTLLKDETENKNQINIYFYDQLNKTLVPESKVIHAKIKEDKIKEVLSILETDTQTQGLVSPFKNVKIKDVQIMEDGQINIKFEKQYEQLTNVEKISLKSAIVMSLSQIEDVRNIQFKVPEEILDTDELKYRLYNKSNIVVNPKITPEDMKMREIVLYFADEQYKNLEKEKRIVYVNPNNLIENYIMESLIEGSKTYNKLVPVETKVLDIKIEGNVCYIDLSADFMQKQPKDEIIQMLSVYSIVNSITEDKNIHEVQFLIDGKRVLGFSESLDLRNTFIRNESLIKHE